MFKISPLCLLLVIATQAAMVFAEDICPVKLRFEKASHSLASTLLNDQSVPAIIASSWREANEKFASEPPQASIARYDLNGDGWKELLLYLSGRGMCGRGGCHLIIFAFNPSKHKLEYQTVHSSSDDILLLNHQSDGYHHLAIRLMDGISLIRAEHYTLYRWQGGDLTQTGETLRLPSPEDHCD